MNKRGLIKFILICAALTISFNFMTTSEIGFGKYAAIPMLFAFLFALTIFMFFNMHKIKKCKFIYDVVLMLLIIFTIGVFLYAIYCDARCFFQPDCALNYDADFTILFAMFLFVMLLFGLEDLFHKTNKTNDVLTIIVSIIIILIHLRYYLDSNFLHNIDGKYSYDSYYYITQDYIYFIIMYAVVMLHRKINKA